MSMKIPMLDTSQEVAQHYDEFMSAVGTIFKSGQFVLGENVRNFESECAKYLGSKHAVSLNSGTDALVIGLRALGIQPGDEVITTPFSFFATVEAIQLIGAVPRFVDIEPEGFNLNVALIEKAITPKTKAILPVHLFGQSAKMDSILEIAAKHKLKILEDVAQAFGGKWNNQLLGSLGQGGAFSFYPTKNLGAYGDGGLFITNDDDAALNARKLRAHGASPTNRYYHEQLGYTSRLDEIQAALLRIKLRNVDEQNQNRIHAALTYQELLEGTKGIQLPKILPQCHHVFHQYTLRVENGKREAVANSLKEMGIATMIYYPVCIHQQSIYGGKNFGSFPEAEKAAGEVLSIPLWPKIPLELQKQVATGLQKSLSY